MISNTELSEVLGSWNLMGESRVALEPGNFQPQKKTSQYERGKDPYLVFKNVPPSINVEILINLCSGFGGKVLRARQHEQFNMFFVNFATIDDLMKVLEGLKVNTLGMIIELGKTAINQSTMPSPVDQNQRDNKIRMPQRTVNFNDKQQKAKDENHNYVSSNFVVLLKLI